MAKENTTGSFVAAIALGSSKVTGIVGRKEQDGTIRVLSHVAHVSTDFISKGRVFNVEKATACFKTIREQLEEQVGRSINPFYVAIDCIGTRSVVNPIEKIFNERITINQEMLNSLALTNSEQKPSERIYLEAIPLEYKLGSIVTTEPLGVMTDSIKTQYLNIVTQGAAVEMIENCFRKAGINIARTKLAATQLGSVVTTEQERSSGVVVVDMGSETTSIAVYRNKLLRHLAVIPLGGANITRDIATVLNCDENEADQLKRTYGFPSETDSEAGESEIIKLRDGDRTVRQSEVADIIAARTEEIVQNIKHQIDLSGYNRETLVNGLFIIGGAAQLLNLSAAFDKHFAEWNIRFLKTPSRLSVSADNRNFNDAGIFNVGLALLENGEDNCNAGERVVPGDLFEGVESAPEPELQPEPQPEPQPEEPKEEKPKGPSKTSSFFGNMWKKVNKLLSEED